MQVAFAGALMMKNAIAILVVLVGCSKKGDEPAKSEKTTTKESGAPSAEAKPTPLPVKAFVELDVATLPFKPQNVLGKQPAEIAKALPQYLRKDKTSAAVKKQTDEMMKEMNKEVEAMGIDTKKGRSDIEFRLPPTPGSPDKNTHVILHNRDDGSVREYGVWFRTTPAEAQEVVKTFDQLWGAHKKIDDVIGARTVWFDAKSGFRASTLLDPNKPGEVDIDYVRYLPLANFFGDPGPLWGFEKKEQPLIGATVEQLEAAYGKDAIKRDEKNNTATLTLPPTDYAGDTAVTTILLFLQGGKVRQWNTNIPFRPYEPARGEYEAALDAKFGKPKPARHDHLIYAKKVDVQYSKYTHELDIEVTR